jgi:predicted MFS family arabinose efflux permease
LRFLPDQRPKTRTPARSELRTALRTVVRIPEVRNLIVRHFLFIFAVTYFFTIFALYVKQQLHAGPEISSWLLACSGAVGGVALLLVAGPLMRRYGDAMVAQAGLALSALAYIAIAFTPYLWAFGVALGVWAIGSSCVEPTLTALLSETAPEDERGAVMGLNDACNNLALIVGPPLGGYAIDLNPHLVGIIPACAVLIAFGLGLAPTRKDDAPALRERAA